MKIPLVKIYTGDDVTDAIDRVLKSGRFVKGGEAEQFEYEFADYIGTEYAVAVNSGTSALYLSYITAGITEGDEVAVPSLTFMATIEPLIFLKARPVFIDICSDGTMDFPQGYNKLKAVVPVHIFGIPAWQDRIYDSISIPVIEDACQAHGAEIKGKKVGSLGTVGCFSFFPTKNMSVLGEGGMVTTNSPYYDLMIRELRNHGRSSKFMHHMTGLNFRMSEIHAAIGRVHLTYLDKWNQRRTQIATRYINGLSGIPGLVIPSPHEKKVAWHLFIVKVPNRRRFKEFLLQRDIQCNIYYEIPCHEQPNVIRYLGKRVSLPETEKFVKHSIALPISPFHTNEEIDYVIEAIKEYFENE